MIIQHYEMSVRDAAGVVYKGTTYFGFFSHDALANQVGIRDAALYEPSAGRLSVNWAEKFAYPEGAAFPDDRMRMVDGIEFFDGAGGPKGLGFIRGVTDVNSDAWFFKAHFFEDPVWPGSLGLESFLHLLKVAAWKRWGGDIDMDAVSFETVALDEKHAWVYRGQILPTDQRVTIEAAITEVG